MFSRARQFQKWRLGNALTVAAQFVFMGKRVRAKDFVADEASADEIEDSPHASDVDDADFDLAAQADEEAEEAEAALKEIIKTRDLLFQWHMFRDLVPNQHVRLVEFKPLPDGRKLWSLNTPHGEIQMPIADEHWYGGQPGFAFPKLHMPEQSYTKCIGSLRRAISTGRYANGAAAGLAKPAARPTKRRKKAPGKSTKNASVQADTGEEKTPESA